MQALLRHPALSPVTLVMVLLPFQWISLGTVGGFNAKLPYAGLAAAIVVAALSPRAVSCGVGLIRRTSVWLLPYAAYILIVFVMLYGSKAQGTPPRQVFFVLGMVAFASLIAAARDPGKLSRWAAGLSVVVFLFATEMIARAIGLSWTAAIARFATSGDLNFVTYQFFRAIFNAASPNPDVLIAASQKNTLAVALLIALQMFRAGKAPGRVDVPGIAATCIVFFILLMLNTRSVLLVAGLSLPLISLVANLRRRHHDLTEAILKTIAVFVIIGAALVFLTTENSLLTALEQRFAFDDASTGARLHQYGWALERIEQNLLTGSGYAELDGQPVHNLFLGAFMHAGLAAFLLIAVFYTGLVLSWLYFVLRVSLAPTSWVLPMRAEWVAMLPLVPLSRMWIAGDAGHPAMAEWVALGCFFGLALANLRQARQLEIRRRSAPERPRTDLAFSPSAA